MHIETKFSNGDVVYHAYVGTMHVQIPCEGCDGSGRLGIVGRDMTVRCPDCYGTGNHGRSEAAPAAQKLTIGRVGVEITDSPGTADHRGEIFSQDGNGFTNYSPIQKREELYMCIETGIGCGSVYPVEDLFSTEQEALERASVKLIEWKQLRAEEEVRREQERLRLAAEYESTEETL